MPPKQRTSLAERESSAPEKNPVYVMVVTQGDKTYKLRNDELGPADRLVCRQQTGLSLQEVLLRQDTDTPLFVLWLARRKSGEPNLNFQQVLAKFKTDREVNELDFRIEDEEGNEVEVEEDPLPEGA